MKKYIIILIVLSNIFLLKAQTIKFDNLIIKFNVTKIELQKLNPNLKFKSDKNYNNSLILDSFKYNDIFYSIKIDFDNTKLYRIIFSTIDRKQNIDSYLNLISNYKSIISYKSFDNSTYNHIFKYNNINILYYYIFDYTKSFIIYSNKSFDFSN